MRKMVGFTLATSFLVVPIALGKPVAGTSAEKEAGAKSDHSRSDLASQVELTSLAKSLKPLRAHFNANKQKYRFVALLSPT